MKELVNVSLLYISTFLNVNVAMFDRTNAEFQLPSPYATHRENQSVHRFLVGNSQNVICYIQDHLFVRYCLAFVGDQVALIGPYRTGRITRQNIPASVFPSEDAWKAYFRYYNTLPDISEQSIRQAASLIFVGIYGGETSVPEKTIDMREYEKGSIPPIDIEYTGSESKTEWRQEVGVDFQLVTLVRSGNYTEALRLYQNLMRSRSKTFILIRTIEGLSTLRAQVRMALVLTGIPANVYAPLFLRFKMKGRTVTSIDEATILAEDLLRKSCELVQDFRTKDYSPGIRAAITYIHNNLSMELGIPMLAEIAQLSPNRFSTRFHKEVGITPSTYILRERMNNAAQLLVYSNLDIQHIGAKVGILDSNYFTRCFRKQFDMSPTEYRRRGVPDIPAEST